MGKDKVDTDKKNIPGSKLKRYATLLPPMVIGSTVAVLGVPAILTAIGFAGTGITAGSAAAKLMSFAWTTRHGIAVVGSGQSVGAAGLFLSSKVGLGIVGAYSGKKIYEKKSGKKIHEEKIKSKL